MFALNSVVSGSAQQSSLLLLEDSGVGRLHVDGLGVCLGHGLGHGLGLGDDVLGHGHGGNHGLSGHLLHLALLLGHEASVDLGDDGRALELAEHAASQDDGVELRPRQHQRKEECAG